jgi:hypothetical protein
MPLPQRRIAGVAVAAALLAGAAAGTAALRSARDQARHDELAEAADGARIRAQDAVHGQLATVEGRAVAAASIPVLRAQLGVVDEATLRDGFSSEPWWEPVRRDFPIYGVAGGGAPEVLVGAESLGLDFAPLVKSAREKRQASSLIVAADAAVAAGGALAEGARRTAWVVVVARPLDGGFLDEVASRSRGAALLSDGKRTLLAAGPAEEQDHLKRAVGKEKEGLFAGDTWAGAASELAPGLWLWSHARPRTAAAAKAPVDLIALWAIAGAAALVSLIVAFRGRPELPERKLPESEAITESSDPVRVVRSNPSATGSTSKTMPATKTGPATTDPGGGVRKAGSIERPKQFGRYYLVDRLGEGGMAEVFTAVAFGAENFRRTFVVKLLHSSAQRTETLVEMFIDEAKLASNLIHSNIIPVYDFGKMGEEYFMAQEYVLGRDLRKLVTTLIEKDKKLLDPRHAVYVARQALHALEYAHTRQTDDGRPMGIVHRDVSPNNVLVSARGEVKLFDFGIAKADEGRLTHTQTGTVKGNVQYMSPEQARGEHVDARADVFSMGLVLYFLLTGRSLYRGETAYQLLVQAAQGLTEEVMPMLDKVPERHGAVLRVALESDREQRFQSAAAFENALSQLPTGTAAELAKEMQRLFGEQLKAEQARFLSIEPPDEPPADAPQGVR